MTVPPDSPSPSGLDCEGAIQRLVACHESGERPADDPRLAAHLGSCLGCFRAAADLKDVPRLAALLRETPDLSAPANAGDPGPAFWAALPAQLGAQFERRRTAGAAETAVPAAAATASLRPAPGQAANASDTPWQRFVRWIRMPVPAAMAGAACATAVALVMTRPPSLQSIGQRPVTMVTEDGGEAETTLSLLGQDDVAFAQSPSVYDSVEELDTGALARVRDSFGNAFEQVLTPQAQLAADDDDPGVGATSTAPNPATVSDDLDQLDEQGLQSLRDQLGGGQ